MHGDLSGIDTPGVTNLPGTALAALPGEECAAGGEVQGSGWDWRWWWGLTPNPPLEHGAGVAGVAPESNLLNCAFKITGGKL